MTETPPQCRRRGCAEEQAWQESFAAAAHPGLCDEHMAAASEAAVR